jgi:hypothetical protein
VVDYTATARIERLVRWLELIATQGYSLVFGARFLKRVIDECIKLPISARWREGSHFQVRVQHDQVVVDAVPARLVGAIQRSRTAMWPELESEHVASLEKKKRMNDIRSQIASLLVLLVLLVSGSASAQTAPAGNEWSHGTTMNAIAGVNSVLSRTASLSLS